MTAAHLEALGWCVITVWECELRSADMAEARLDALAEDIRRAGERRQECEALRRKNRQEAKMEREAALKRLAELEREIDELYPIPKGVKREAERN